MKRFIKILSLLIVFSVAASLFTACGGGDKTPAQDIETASAVSDETQPGIDVDFNDVMPAFINPLTGLEAEYDVSKSRPLGVMFNNIWDALPQIGIGNADIVFECLAEGGITRLFALFAEYRGTGVLGSIRSSRPYYLDFAQMFDAIYCHAGGSEDAYSEIAYRGINNIDGVRGDPLGVYYRDQTRMQTMAIEHTLMTTFEGLVRTIEYCGYRTDLREGYDYPYSFSAWGKVEKPGGEECLKIHLPISPYQTVDYEYDAEKELYLRYQYNGSPHIDGATGEQLSFTNVIVIFCNTYAYDDYGRLRVDTVGEGDGYFASEGEYVSIKWQRADRDGNVSFVRADNGEKIVLNRGKTFVNVCPTTIMYDVNMNLK